MNYQNSFTQPHDDEDGDERSTCELTSAGEFVTRLIILSDGSLYYSTISALLPRMGGPSRYSALLRNNSAMLQNYGIEDIWREKKMELKKKEFLVWVSTDG